ncbi:MAG TPA: methyl-accepting chemotaxis protein [Candidatus Binatia bacterium]|nr:methyl-accepting chemotaxis protein [Candidatus Binatia bacterium]
MTAEAKGRRAAAQETPPHSKHEPHEGTSSAPTPQVVPPAPPPRPLPEARPGSAPPFSVAAFVAALVAGLFGHFLPGAMGFGAAVVAAIFGAVAVALLSGSADVRRAASEELVRERERASLAADQLEKSRRHADLATVQFREGKDPLTEVPELRVGPLRELLEAARESATIPVVSRLTMSEEELVAADGEPLPVPWPAGADELPPAPPASEPPAARPAYEPEAAPASRRAEAADAAARAGILKELNALIAGLGELATGLEAPASAPGEGAGRTPAQLVDAVVHTAADGIEDLAAGLMRANELASVAERVTNKATLLALNAALEATRSGSEAFAAIAEETRRLAEFAREATDTIARLSSEIEYKVGETITAIHATSEDAKSVVATFQASPGAPPIPTAAVEALLRRAQELKRRLLAEAA